MFRKKSAQLRSNHWPTKIGQTISDPFDYDVNEETDSDNENSDSALNEEITESIVRYVIPSTTADDRLNGLLCRAQNPLLSDKQSALENLFPLNIVCKYLCQLFLAIYTSTFRAIVHPFIHSFFNLLIYSIQIPSLELVPKINYDSSCKYLLLFS